MGGELRWGSEGLKSQRVVGERCDERKTWIVRRWELIRRLLEGMYGFDRWRTAIVEAVPVECGSFATNGSVPRSVAKSRVASSTPVEC